MSEIEKNSNLVYIVKAALDEVTETINSFDKVKEGGVLGSKQTRIACAFASVFILKVNMALYPDAVEYDELRNLLEPHNMLCQNSERALNAPASFRIFPNGTKHNAIDPKDWDAFEEKYDRGGSLFEESKKLVVLNARKTTELVLKEFVQWEMPGLTTAIKRLARYVSGGSDISADLLSDNQKKHITQNANKILFLANELDSDLELFNQIFEDDSASSLKIDF